MITLVRKLSKVSQSEELSKELADVINDRLKFEQKSDFNDWLSIVDGKKEIKVMSFKDFEGRIKLSEIKNVSNNSQLSQKITRILNIRLKNENRRIFKRWLYSIKPKERGFND